MGTPNAQLITNVNTISAPPSTRVIVKVKPVWQSLTFWFNLITLVSSALDQFAHAGLISLFVRDPIMAKNLTDMIVALVAFINILLRFKTTQPVTLKAS